MWLGYGVPGPIDLNFGVELTIWGLNMIRLGMARCITSRRSSRVWIPHAWADHIEPPREGLSFVFPVLD